MKRNYLLKNERKILNEMTELNFENKKFIEGLLSDCGIIKIWENLSDCLKRNKDIQKLFAKYINYNSLNIMKKQMEEVGVSEEEFFNNIKEYNNNFYQSCVRLNRIPMKLKIKAIIEEPKLARFLTLEDPLKEIIQKQPQASKYLPSTIQQTTEILGDTALKMTEFWQKDGKTIQYFKIGNGIILKDRDDYIKIVKAYINKNISIEEFCSKYGIDSLENFKLVISKIASEEKEIGEQLKKVEEKNKENHIKFLKESISDIILGKTTILNIINSHPEISAEDFFESKKYLEEEKYNKLLQKFVNEIGMDKKPETEKEVDKYGVEFLLIGKSTIEDLIKYFSVDKDKGSATDAFNGIIKLSNVARESSKVKQFNESKIKSRVKAYEKGINEEEFLNNVSFICGDKTVKPTEEDIEDAIEYLKATDRYLCHQNAKFVLKSIAKGILTKEKIEQAKNEKENKKTELIENDYGER